MVQVVSGGVRFWNDDTVFKSLFWMGFNDLQYKSKKLLEKERCNIVMLMVMHK